MIDSDYYNDEYMQGEARMECEGTFNTIWYRGVPRKHLQCVFLEKENESEILLLGRGEATESLKAKLNSSLFKDLDFKELVHFRRHLLHKDRVIFNGEEKSLSLIERIRYYDASQPPTTILKNLEEEGFKFATERELFEESLRRAAGRQIIREKVSQEVYPKLDCSLISLST